LVVDHGLNRHHLQAYLDEFIFRFQRPPSPSSWRSQSDSFAPIRRGIGYLKAVATDRITAAPYGGDFLAGDRPLASIRGRAAIALVVLYPVN